MKFPAKGLSGYTNVFGIQVDGTKNYEAGSRIPGVWIRNGYELKIFYTPKGTMQGFGTPFRTGNYGSTIKNGVNTGKWINLKVSQTSGVIEIKVDNKLVKTGTNQSPQTWSNVNVVIGNTYDKYKAAVGEYRNFEITNL